MQQLGMVPMVRTRHPSDDQIVDHVGCFSNLAGQLVGLKELKDALTRKRKATDASQ
jgi:hypothetical protein